MEFNGRTLTALADFEMLAGGGNGNANTFCVTFDIGYPENTADKTYTEIEAALMEDKRIYGVIAGDSFDTLLPDVKPVLRDGYFVFRGAYCDDNSERINGTEEIVVIVRSDGTIENDVRKLVDTQLLQEYLDNLPAQDGSNADWVATMEVIDGSQSIVIAEQTITYGMWSKRQTDIQPDIIYDVYIGDRIYPCKAYNYDGGIVLGNYTISLASANVPHNNEPFYIYWAGGSATAGMFGMDSTLSYPITFKVTEHTEEKYNKLPVGYLPEVKAAEVGKTILVEEVDSNGRPTKWKAVDYQPRTHHEEIVDVVHVPLVTTKCNISDEQEGYICDAPSEIIEGGTYNVLFDGTTYTGQLKQVEVEGYGKIYLVGNAKVFADILAQLGVTVEGEDTGEPFVAMANYFSYEQRYQWGILAADSNTHTFSITGATRAVQKISGKYISANVVEVFPQNTAEVGSICMLNLAGTADKCDDGEPFMGLCLRQFDILGDSQNVEVQIAGYITVPYRGVTPPCGYTKLSANGAGGVKVDTSGREYLVTRFDSVAGTCTIRL